MVFVRGENRWNVADLFRSGIDSPFLRYVVLRSLGGSFDDSFGRFYLVENEVTLSKRGWLYYWYARKIAEGDLCGLDGPGYQPAISSKAVMMIVLDKKLEKRVGVGMFL